MRKSFIDTSNLNKEVFEVETVRTLKSSQNVLLSTLGRVQERNLFIIWIKALGNFRSFESVRFEETKRFGIEYQTKSFIEFQKFPRTTMIVKSPRFQENVT